MRLHRLVLSNYRGITHREIEFPERGVTVVSGPNEVGKSSLIEALDLLLESKDRSAKKDVKQVKPTHADVGSEVTAEISTGAYRFVYRKRFHKKCETELTILAPRREQVTGDEAHDRVRAMLAETVDTGLWQAQRVLQAASTAAVDLSGCDALSRALDVAAGDADDLAGLSGSEPLLIERIDAEYGRYFTATGRPTGEWATVRAALDAATAEVADCESAVAEVDHRVRRHAELATELAELVSGREDLTERLAAAEAADKAVAALTDERSAARERARAERSGGNRGAVEGEARAELNAMIRNSESERAAMRTLIAIPVYNEEKYVTEILRRVLDLGPVVKELVVVDDRFPELVDAIKVAAIDKRDHKIAQDVIGRNRHEADVVADVASATGNTSEPESIALF